MQRRSSIRRSCGSRSPSTPIMHTISPSSSMSIPATIQFLKQFTLEIDASTNYKKAKDVRYDLHIQLHSASQSSWYISRSYKEYRALQKRLLQAVKRGHFCTAECPWLFSFLKSNFPKECYLYSASAYVIDKRCEAFDHCLTTLHNSLLKRDNYGCSILMNTVALELVEFINTAIPVDHDARWENFKLRGSLVIQKSPVSLSSSSNRTILLTSSDEEQPLNVSIIPCDVPVCEQEPSILDKEEHNSPLRCSFVKLDCGHQFPDEYIVTKLNESMHCPTCGAHVSS